MSVRALLCAAAVAVLTGGCDDGAGKSAPTTTVKTGTVRIQREVFPSILLQAGDGEIQSPMQLFDDATAAGGKRACAPEGPNHQELSKGGAVVFKFDVAQPGDYHLWARAHWCCSCGNSLGVSLDGMDFVEGIEDGTFQKWHWVRFQRPLQRLSAGKHQLVIKSREDGSSFDQILLTQDSEYRPSGIEQTNVAKRTTLPPRTAESLPATTTTTVPPTR